MATIPAFELLSRAEAAERRGAEDEALAAYRELETIEPSNGLWANRVANVLRRVGRRTQELAALERAADAYWEAGLPLKAIVMLKRILDLEPTGEVVRRHLFSRNFPERALQGLEERKIVLRPDRPLLDGEEGSLREIPVFETSDLSSAFEAMTVETEDIDAERPRFPLTPFFAAVSEDAFAELLADLKIRTYDKGEVIFRQGDPGSSMFVVSEGSVAVTLERPERIQLARFDPGELFGELSILTERPRTASVEAMERTELIEIERMVLQRLIEQDPVVMPCLMWFMRDRLVDILIRTSPIFRPVPLEQRKVLARAFRFVEATESVRLVEQGQRSDRAVILLTGEADVIRTFERARILIGRLSSGDVCGEMSLMSGEPALASVTTEGYFLGLELSREEWERLVMEHPELLGPLQELAERRRLAFVEALESQPPAEDSLPFF